MNRTATTLAGLALAASAWQTRWTRWPRRKAAAA
jgi:hypothetical protein